MWRPDEYVPESEDVGQFQEGGVDEDGEGILLEEFRKKDHSFTLFAKFAGSQAFSWRQTAKLGSSSRIASLLLKAGHYY